MVLALVDTGAVGEDQGVGVPLDIVWESRLIFSHGDAAVELRVARLARIGAALATATVDGEVKATAATRALPTLADYLVGSIVVPGDGALRGPFLHVHNGRGRYSGNKDGDEDEVGGVNFLGCFEDFFEKRCIWFEEQ
jgi:hypothetical protein